MSTIALIFDFDDTLTDDSTTALLIKHKIRESSGDIILNSGETRPRSSWVGQRGASRVGAGRRFSGWLCGVRAS
jgi:hypothetical protein